MLALVGLLLVLGFLALREIRAPKLGADVLSYMALALEWEEKDPLELHRRTEELARSELGPQTFEELTAPGTRGESFRDQSAFEARLPFLRPRVLYTIVLRWLHQLGSPLSAATWQVTLTAWGMLALLALAWSIGHVPLAAAALIALGIALTPPLWLQATQAGADALAALFVALGAFFLVERRLFAFGAAVLTLAIAARLDTLILIVALALALLVFQPREKRPGLVVLVLWVALSAGAFVALQRFAHSPGWQARFQEEFGASGSQLASAGAIDWNLWREVLARQVRELPGEASPIVFLHAGLALVGIVLGLLRGRTRNAREVALLFALLATVAVRFLLFPRLCDGPLWSFYVLVPLAFTAIVARAVSGEEESVPVRASARRPR